MEGLDQGEIELLESYERTAWRSVSDLKSKSGRYCAYAAETFRKDKRVNIHISQKDLLTIQKKAIEEGNPYQTLISSILR